LFQGVTSTSFSRFTDFVQIIGSRKWMLLLHLSIRAWISKSNPKCEEALTQAREPRAAEARA
jgi:hypothetical protein